MTNTWPRPFRWLYAADLATGLGNQVGMIAVPVLAVEVLRAGPGQVGLLGALAWVAFLLIGLPAGVWVDRAPRRTVIIVADLVRALLYASIPVAWWAGWLGIGQLYAVVLLTGAATVFGDVAAQSLVPQLVGRDRLVAANSLIVSTWGVLQVGGRGLGGVLVQLLTAPVSLAVNAVAHLVSAAALTRIPVPPAPADDGSRPHFGRQLGEGVRHVLGSPLLRPLAVSTSGINLSVNLITVLLPVVLLGDLGLSPGMLGLFLAVGGVGSVLGAVTARRLADRIGPGRSLWLPGLLVAPAGALVAMVDTGAAFWLATLGWLAIAWRTGIGNVIGVSLRQTSTPDALLGRMNATFRFLLTGALAVGAALAGLLGTYVSVRATLWIGAIGNALTWLPILLSPLRNWRQPATTPPQPVAQPGGARR
ncbi:MFS transporter [Micromonospora mirobrigensis]|uniref:Predicted arabinose efflux permease, MFS family n=1 Tax=Micromonospora mirobrigensis TaxID=262898 RepID=A0A1C4WD63_9ACTN|nr:MFS transporter [Micromonospora mirobrigensis]SCE94059.1 Predicted arabinose efflux permease, MFS family [Micromonospora mirobrigensis]